jgi:hypothetical protein
MADQPDMKPSRRDFLTQCGVAATGAAWLNRGAGAAVPGPFSQYTEQALAILGQMTLEEKIGQMTQPDKLFLQSPDDVAN